MHVLMSHMMIAGTCGRGGFALTFIHVFLHSEFFVSGQGLIMWHMLKNFLRWKNYSCMILLRGQWILTENGVIFRERTDGICMWILISNIKCIEIFCKHLYNTSIQLFLIKNVVGWYRWGVGTPAMMFNAI